MMILIIFSIISMTIMVLIKILGGLLSGSISLLADGLDSLINIFTMSIAYLSFKKSKYPPDTDHRYGHWGFQDYSVIILSIVLILVGSGIIFTSVSKLGFEHVISWDAILYAIISTIILVGSFLSYYFIGVKEDSRSLIVESKHLFVDLFESILVLAGVSISVFISSIYDLLVAIIIGVLMYIIAAQNLKDIYTVITHKMPIPNLDDKIIKLALDVNGVMECHNIRARQIGGKIFIDLHILIDKNMDISTAHKIAHVVEERIKKNLSGIEDVIVHIEPIEK